MRDDSNVRYGTVSRCLHWGMALLLGWQMLKFFDRINDGEHWVGQTLVSWHVSIGTLLLVLIVLRIVWANLQRNHRPAQDPATATLVKIGHFLLYACMAILPIAGIMILIGNGYGLTAFGVPLVAGGEKIEWMANLGGAVHSPLAWVLLVMVIGHIGIALVHHFMKRDGVLQRML